MFALISKINPGAWWLIFAIATDVLSTFYSAKGNGLVNKTAQGIALVLYIISFACAAIALKYMQAGILYVLWSVMITVVIKHALNQAMSLRWAAWRMHVVNSMSYM